MSKILTEKDLALSFFSLEQKILDDYFELRNRVIEALSVAKACGNKTLEKELSDLDIKIGDRIAAILALQGENLKISVVIPKNETTH